MGCRQRTAKAREHTEAHQSMLVHKQMQRLGLAVKDSGGSSQHHSSPLEPKHIERWLVVLALAARMRCVQQTLKARASYLMLNFRREKV